MPTQKRNYNLALVKKNTATLITPENLRLKMLIYGLPGLGKTTFLSTVPNIGIAACETGVGKGLLSVAGNNLEYVEPLTLADFDEVCSGKTFADKDAIGLDSLTTMSNTFIKEAALKIPRMRGDSQKRKEGVPELDDYMVMAEITRKMLWKLLALPQHNITTATEKYKGPDLETGQGETKIGPELPGQMFEGSAAMFDFVFRLRSRQKLRDPKDPKSRYVERYFITQPDGSGTIAKCRSNAKGVPLLDKEEIFDPQTGQGTFPYLLAKILKGYADDISKGV
jgi:hypothetical protein